jgi:amino acid transporter
VKGVELPINILVIVAIAVIVLLGLVALYFIGFNPFSVTTAVESAKNNACRDYLHQNPVCSNAAGVSLDYPAGTATTLDQFTNTYYGCSNTATDESCVRRVCGCPGY